MKELYLIGNLNLKDLPMCLINCRQLRTLELDQCHPQVQKRTILILKVTPIATGSSDA